MGPLLVFPKLGFRVISTLLLESYLVFLGQGFPTTFFMTLLHGGVVKRTHKLLEQEKEDGGYFII